MNANFQQKLVAITTALTINVIIMGVVAYLFDGKNHAAHSESPYIVADASPVPAMPFARLAATGGSETVEAASVSNAA